jgi:hypothetical protein
VQCILQAALCGFFMRSTITNALFIACDESFSQASRIESFLLAATLT